MANMWEGVVGGGGGLVGFWAYHDKTGTRIFEFRME